MAAPRRQVTETDVQEARLKLAMAKLRPRARSPAEIAALQEAGADCLQPLTVSGHASMRDALLQLTRWVRNGWVSEQRAAEIESDLEKRYSIHAAYEALRVRHRRTGK